ncbi:MAG TPA: ParB/RepB/Spo0J family partition protein [Elainellaceae cyanobacterium]
MSKKKFDSGVFDSEPEVDIQAVDDAAFGTGGLQPSGKRITGKPVDIYKLRADVTQPRRTVPLSVRGDWDGTADEVEELLNRWGDAVKKEYGKPILPHLVVRGLIDEKNPIDVDEKTQPITSRYVDLLKLAASIRRDGLLNPIQICQEGTGGQIIAGERRWLAHHILHLYDDDIEKWSMIPAVQTDKPDVWAQAAENGARVELNAIERARQLALLLMDMYQDEFNFDTYEDIVKTGVSDRTFYAQVADGNEFPVKYGKMTQILGARGGWSRKNVQRYRDLLNLDDKNWSYADEKNWSERRCRRILHPERFEPKQDKKGEMSPMGDNDGDLQVGSGYSQRYDSPTPPDTTEGNPISAGQIRRRGDGAEIPYIKVIRKFDRGDWQVEMHDATGRDFRMMSAKAIVEYYPVVLDYVPSNPTQQAEDREFVDVNKRRTDDSPSEYEQWKHDTGRTDEAIKGRADVDLMGYGETDYPSDPESGRVSGERRPSQYQNEPRPADEPWDSPQRRMPETDGADEVALLMQYEELRICLNHFMTMCHTLDLPTQNNLLRQVQLLTTASIERKVQKMGVDGFRAKEVETIEQALQDIFNEFVFHWNEFLGDVQEIAESVEVDDE